MAKKGHKKHKPTRRRKKMGAVNSDALMLLLGGISGAVAAHVGDVVFTGQSSYLSFGEIAGGGALAYFPKNPFLKEWGLELRATVLSWHFRQQESSKALQTLQGSTWQPITVHNAGWLATVTFPALVISPNPQRWAVPIRWTKGFTPEFTINRLTGYR